MRSSTRACGMDSRRGDASSRAGAWLRAAAGRTALGTPSPPPGDPHPAGLAPHRASASLQPALRKGPAQRSDRGDPPALSRTTEDATLDSGDWASTPAQSRSAEALAKADASSRAGPRGSWLGEPGRVAAARLGPALIRRPAAATFSRREKSRCGSLCSRPCVTRPRRRHPLADAPAPASRDFRSVTSRRVPRDARGPGNPGNGPAVSLPEPFRQSPPLRGVPHSWRARGFRVSGEQNE